MQKLSYGDLPSCGLPIQKCRKKVVNLYGEPAFCKSPYGKVGGEVAGNCCFIRCAGTVREAHKKFEITTTKYMGCPHVLFLLLNFLNRKFFVSNLAELGGENFLEKFQISRPCPEAVEFTFGTQSHVIKTLIRHLVYICRSIYNETLLKVRVFAKCRLFLGMLFI